MISPTTFCWTKHSSENGIVAYRNGILVDRDVAHEAFRCGDSVTLDIAELTHWQFQCLSCAKKDGILW